MRTPVFWFVGWIILAGAIVLFYPWLSSWVSVFWFGWSAGIIGQDIGDWLKQRKERLT